MKKIFFIALVFNALFVCAQSQNSFPEPRDLYSDTWVGTDAIGRKMPLNEEVGTIKTDQRRVTGIFYITWHGQGNKNLPQPYAGNVTEVLQKAPAARLDAKNPEWKMSSYHWGEPETGYFLSQDEWVIRKDMSMLTDAGIDVLVMDVTNAVRYWDEWDVTFQTMQKMKAEGNKVPQFCFWAFNGPVITVVQDLYEKIYKTNKYRNLWFYWDGKPLLLCNGNPFVAAESRSEHPNPNYDSLAVADPANPHYLDPDFTEKFYKDYTKEVKEFFTIRTMWWGYYNWDGKRFIGTEDNWSFGYSMAEPEVKALKPIELLSTHKGKREQAAVTPAQHPVTMTKENMGVGKSWSRQNGEPPLNEYDMPQPAYVPWLGKTVEHPEDYGIYFQERWDEVLQANPEFLYINDWNEWTAGKYNDTVNWLGRRNPFMFVDQYNAEFNRCIYPMKGGYTDNYYMQMAQNIRRYKGARPIPVQNGFAKISIDSDFADWDIITNEFRDTRGDVTHRDSYGYANIHYVNNSGRNDIVTAKVAVDENNIYFFAETDNALTQPTDPNWMLLLIDADNNSETGWYGYDYLINKQAGTLMKYSSKSWKKTATLSYSCKGNRLEIAVPRTALKINGKEGFTIDFKWSDNPASLTDPISLCTDGDTAPNRRFNYRLIWKK
ncbi:MAG: hypothetical protein LBS52_00800 [Dysgonamonadaceae bacterium]|jgi:hypothetical protein|nr:hypothetical protein [Dysgonamonadaceae bacterium]